jgi:ADP-ribose pyrophosphatase YjhB (NUDIX family)
LIDDRGRLVLMKRTKPGQPPYWTASGGGVEEADGSVEAALHRELAEELGAEASRVFLCSSRSDSGIAVQHFFVARLVAMDEARRGGPELADPGRGGYDVDRVDLLGDDLARVDLKPEALKEFIMANREALLAESVAGVLPSPRAWNIEGQNLEQADQFAYPTGDLAGLGQQPEVVARLLSHLSAEFTCLAASSSYASLSWR